MGHIFMSDSMATAAVVPAAAHEVLWGTDPMAGVSVHLKNHGYCS